MEIWKQITGFETLYSVSTKGRVKSFGKGKSTNPKNNVERIIKPSVGRGGYEKIKLFKDGKRHYFSAHRLVAETFLFNPENKKEVNHKDGNKLNNCADNLEWCTPSENQIHAFEMGLQKRRFGKDNSCSKRIIQLTKEGEFVREWESINQAKKELGYNSMGIIKCCKKEKRYKTAYGYKWQYKDA